MYRQQHSALRMRPYRPRLELLEVRNLLSTYTVDHLADDFVGDGLHGSLRYCITHATDGDDIQFGVTGTINLTRALPNLTHSISIEGPRADQLTVQRDPGATGYYRIFEVLRGSTVSIAGLTIANGLLYSRCDDGDTSFGGGIENYGTLTISASTLSGNGIIDSGISCPPAEGSPGFGGAIYNEGTLTVSNSIMIGNSAVYGGGLMNFGTATISNSTISNNRGLSGGILNDRQLHHGRLTVSNSTISGNTSWGILNGFFSGGGALHARNTIIAGNGGDLSGNLGSLGHNLIGNTQGGSGFDPTDLLNVNPMLGPLQDNGGPTLTMALLAGSPAIDAGDNTDAPDWDQRGEGFPRIVGIIDPDNPVIDIGAYEVQDDGNGPGRSAPPRGKPLHLDIAGLAVIQPSQPVSQIARETKPDVVVVDALFANDSIVQPGVGVGRSAATDTLAPLVRHKGLGDVDDFDLSGVFLAH
jgi:hypothetical protein